MVRATYLFIAKAAHHEDGHVRVLGEEEGVGSLRDMLLDVRAFLEHLHQVGRVDEHL
jgi:hypothetical protein